MGSENIEGIAGDKLLAHITTAPDGRVVTQTLKSHSYTTSHMWSVLAKSLNSRWTTTCPSRRPSGCPWTRSSASRGRQLGGGMAEAVRAMEEDPTLLDLVLAIIRHQHDNQRRGERA